MELKKRLIGTVPVDCATLVICDPIYYGLEPQTKGKVEGVKFWGAGAKTVREELQKQGVKVGKKFDTDLIETDDREEAERLVAIIEEISSGKEAFVMTEIREDDAMTRIFDATYSDNGDGNVEGLDGVVSVCTGSDGYFPVYGYFDENGWLVKIEIEIMETE